MNEVIFLNLMQIIILIVIIAGLFYKYLLTRELMGILWIGLSFVILLIYAILEFNREIFEEKNIVYPFYVSEMRTIALIFMGYAIFYAKYGGREHKYILEMVLCFGTLLNTLLLGVFIRDYSLKYKIYEYYTYETYLGVQLLRDIQLGILLILAILSFRLWVKNKTKSMFIMGIAFALWGLSVLLLMGLQISSSRKMFITQFIVTISYILFGYVAFKRRHFLLDIVPTFERGIRIRETDKKAELSEILQNKGIYTITRDILLFKELLKEGAEGLILTKVEPNVFKERHEITKTPIIWLTPPTDTDEMWCDPRRLTLIKRAIGDFAERTKYSVILIDFEYLVGHNRKNQMEILDFSSFLFKISSKTTILIIGNKREKISELAEIDFINPIIIEDILNTAIPPEIQKEQVRMLNKDGFTFLKYDKKILVRKTIISKEEFENIFKTILNYFDEDGVRAKILEEIKKYYKRISNFILKRGESYLTSIENGFKLFNEYPTKNKLCITRLTPEKIVKKYGMGENDAEFRWLSNIEGIKNISPVDLARILVAIREFGTDNDDYVIIINGLDYLAFQNGDEATLKTIELINEFNIIRKGIIIYLVDDRLLEEYSMLVREMSILM